ncbi:MAG: 2,3-diphosphoglycerate synthetase [Actinomycetota bacterium]
MASKGEVVAALLLGGEEKLPPGRISSLGGIEVLSGPDPRAALDQALLRLRPDAVIDLSDEPVLDYRRRFELAALTLFRGIPYVGADFRFEPPPRPRLADKPSIALIGTGKRTGKTAVAAFAARTLQAAGRGPVVVAMGRGGPAEPEVLRGDELILEPKDLLDFADAGRHAASDYIEDALLARVPTVGCRRCGGGLAGGVEHSNVGRGVALANELPAELVLVEGSGSAIPPVHADTTLLVVPASIPPEYLAGYMGPYRLLLSDFVVITMCEEPFGSSTQISTITAQVKRTFGLVNRGEDTDGPEVIRTVFRPTPTRSVEGATVLVATTAPEEAGDAIRRHLEGLGCRVAGMTHALSARERLESELGGYGKGADVLLCEIKAAAIDVATRWALDQGLEVVYMDNVPHGVGGDDPASAVLRAAELAEKRFEAHGDGR